MSPARKTTRRQFLQGASAVEAVGDILHGIDFSEVDSSRQYPPGSQKQPLIHFGRRAMACEFEVILDPQRDPPGPEAALEALDLVEQLEAQMTVFHDSSEISRINRQAAEGTVNIEKRLFDLLAQALELNKQTHGAFDMTAGPLSKIWGFSRRQGRVPGQADLEKSMQKVGSHYLQLCSQESSVRFTQSGVEINLGGIGKGYALDRCAELLLEAGVENFLIHAGQSSVLAHGTHQQTRETKGWQIGVCHPLQSETRLLEISLADQALGTSGSGTQFFHYQGKRYGHILDPRTGQPAEGVLSSTVVAPTAAEADALATAFYVLGVDQAMEYCQQRPELSALLICHGKTRRQIEIHSCGLEDSKWEQLDSSTQCHFARK